MKKRQFLKCVSSIVGVLLSTNVLSGQYEFHQRVPGLKSNVDDVVVDLSDASSCKELKNRSSSIPSGNYTITTVSGNDIAVYCDMDSYGGGWTLIVSQYELSPVAWNVGVSSSFVPSFSEKVGFSLSSSQIPSHSEVAFGKDDEPAYVDYFDYTYTTGNLPVSLITGKKTGLNYQIYRDVNRYFAAHDPEDRQFNSPGSQWVNTLSIDLVGVLHSFSWAFTPRGTNPQTRGYAMSGEFQNSREDFAWTVWVR